MNAEQPLEERLAEVFQLSEPESDSVKIRVHKRLLYWVAIPEGTKQFDWVSPPHFIRLSREAALERAIRYARTRLHPQRRPDSSEHVWVDV